MTASRRAITIYLPLSLATIILLFPFYWMLITSIKTNRELIDLSGLPFWVFEPTLEHYRYLFAETGFLRWALNTVTISVVATAISLACSILAGYALARLRFRGAGAMAGAIFVTYLVPQTLLFVPLLEVVRQLGLSNTLWSMILTYPTILIPFSTWLLMGYFRSIPRELEESALIDGASRLRAMAQIVMPLALPGILSAAIFAFTLSWNEFIYALVFTNSTDIKTIPVGVVTELVKGDVYFWGSLMAGALLGSVPVALIYSFFVDKYVGGLTAGAVKG
ncbi:MAG TPA: carbohydrate ABC transporter permease [Candidatus Limnocylindria bacterium]|jgi:multiple sugar transport system permease protein|nr:carbohydrate ABC transporter permease [Candidatus Limnocylindria bacterium]